MINRALYNLTARLPAKLIPTPSGEPYLERYFVGQLLGWTFYLHRLLALDGERGLHNHPWKYGAAFVLAGSYLEERAIDLCPRATGSGLLTELKRVRFYNRVDGSAVHRIAAVAPGTWTLFAHGPKQMVHGAPKGWGFFRSISGSETLFINEPSSPPSHARWWRRAPTGAEVGRQPLSE